MECFQVLLMVRNGIFIYYKNNEVWTIKNRFQYKTWYPDYILWDVPHDNKNSLEDVFVNQDLILIYISAINLKLAYLKHCHYPPLIEECLQLKSWKIIMEIQLIFSLKIICIFVTVFYYSVCEIYCRTKLGTNLGKLYMNCPWKYLKIQQLL